MNLRSLVRNLTAPIKGALSNLFDIDPFYTSQKEDAMIPTIPDKIARIGLSQHWVRETSKNQGDGIEKFWTATSYPDGYKNREPYCAAYVCWVVREAFEEARLEETAGFRLPTTPRAWGFEHWALAQDSTTHTKKKPRGDIERGDLVVFAFSHIGIALGRPDKNGHFHTIEANTDNGGSREGDGVHEKIRSMELVKTRIRFTV